MCQERHTAFTACCCPLTFNYPLLRDTSLSLFNLVL
jgi:hypothetical protein